MLAFARSIADDRVSLPEDAARRMARSLCAGIGGEAADRRIGSNHFAYRALDSNAAKARTWRPAMLGNGWLAAFHGYFDNAAAIAAELGCNQTDLARLYGEAVAKWGDEADRKIVGEYCAILSAPDTDHVRLSRSPLRGPPLCYGEGAGFVAAASVPRALFAVGIPRELNEARVADSSVLHFVDEESGWFKSIRRVPLGCIVELTSDQKPVLRRYYHLRDCPDVRLDSDAAYIQRASELLDEAVRACIAGAKRPGSTLSSGLDSSQIAVRALKAIGPGRKLPTFTFYPEDGWDGNCEKGMLGNERPWVEDFAAGHPGLEPHFTDNAGYANDHRWPEMFHLMDGAPSGMCNMYVFHGIWEEAAKQGCDRLLLAEWGNYTFSDKGEWAFVEYLLSGRWRQLWRMLRDNPHDTRSMLRRFVAMCVMPLLPRWLWHPLKRLVHANEQPDLDLICPLTATYRESSGANARLEQSGFQLDRYQPRNRRHAQALLFANSECESAEVHQCFEQLYGVAQRDPTAWRPFVEFCFGLPVHMFARDGTLRWLAKELAKGVMPERQRANLLNGRWDSDWQLRLQRKRREYLDELDRIARDPRLSAMVDVPRLRRALEAMPQITPTDRQTVLPLEMAIPRGILAARFIRYAEGRNET